MDISRVFFYYVPFTIVIITGEIRSLLDLDLTLSFPQPVRCSHPADSRNLHKVFVSPLCRWFAYTASSRMRSPYANVVIATASFQNYIAVVHLLTWRPLDRIDVKVISPHLAVVQLFFSEKIRPTIEVHDRTSIENLKCFKKYLGNVNKSSIPL